MVCANGLCGHTFVHVPLHCYGYLHYLSPLIAIRSNLLYHKSLIAVREVFVWPFCQCCQTFNPQCSLRPQPLPVSAHHSNTNIHPLTYSLSPLLWWFNIWAQDFKSYHNCQVPHVPYMIQASHIWSGTVFWSCKCTVIRGCCWLNTDYTVTIDKNWWPVSCCCVPYLCIIKCSLLTMIIINSSEWCNGLLHVHVSWYI